MRAQKLYTQEILMRFIGNKESLAPKIYEILKKHKIIAFQKSQSFFDMFAGSTSMGRFFKQKGFNIYSCDLLYFSYCLQKAYLENNQYPTFEILQDKIESFNSNATLFENIQTPYQKVLNYLNALPCKKGFIYHNYSPSGSRDLKTPRMYFSDNNAAKIDAIRWQIEVWKIQNQINENEYFILLATLIESLSFYANVAGVYAAFCKNWDKRALKPFKLKAIELLLSNTKHFCFCGESKEILKSFEDSIFDILYMDPPYNHRQYAPNYHLVETIAKYDNPTIRGVAGLREWQSQKSAFCNAKTALSELEKIAKIKNYKTLVLSYNSEGIMKESQIKEVLEPLGNVIFEKIPCTRFKSNANNGAREVFEYLWILQK
ncbi:DNA adenine methylase [Helicobacter marmotae]|nr:DNA adenine methylase [Helicobacter marmotae]